jgi:hypothetical protein
MGGYKNKSLKQIHKESIMIGGRIDKARREFLHPNLSLSRIVGNHPSSPKV